MKDLRPCPFCGTSRGIVEPVTEREVGEYAFVRCSMCCAEGPGGLTEEEAADNWNVRR